MIRVVRLALLIVGLAAGAVFIWPTPWAYYPLREVRGRALELRRNRFTGVVERLGPEGWVASSTDPSSSPVGGWALDRDEFLEEFHEASQKRLVGSSPEERRATEGEMASAEAAMRVVLPPTILDARLDADHTGALVVAWPPEKPTRVEGEWELVGTRLTVAATKRDGMDPEGEAAKPIDLRFADGVITWQVSDDLAVVLRRE